MKPLDHCPSLETLIDLSYGEMEPIEAGPVQSHLETCAACALEWDSLLAAQALAGELPVGPVMPSPEVEARLAAMVAARQPLWDRLFRSLWDAVSSPVPAYKAMLGGAVIALVVQLLIGSSQAVSPTISEPIRPPDPRASAIRIQPVQDLNQPPYPRQELEQSVDAIPPDNYAQVF